MKIRVVLIGMVLLLGCSGVGAQQAENKSTKAAPAAKSPSSSKSDQGARKFQMNCGRCHKEPEDLSPREARTAIRHMRVRAMLSAEDEQLILKFLAP